MHETNQKEKDRKMKKAALILLSVLLVSISCPLVPCVGADYQPQPANKSSGLKAADDGDGVDEADEDRIWDDEFAKWIKDNVGNEKYEKLIFVFGQCYGGGMIDEVMRKNVAAHSASRHDQKSCGEETKEEHVARCHPGKTVAELEKAGYKWPSYVKDKPESGFLKGWADDAKDKTKTLGQIFASARDKDPFGPKGTTWKNLEEPQEKYQPDAAKNQKLHSGESNYVILFAGQPDKWRHWNNVERIYGILKNVYGYTDAEIIVLYGEKKKPDGTATPAWVDSTAKKADLKKEIEKLKDKMKPGETLLFWSTDHGDLKKRDVTKADPVIPPMGTVQILFDLSQSFVDVMSEPWVFANTSGVTSSTNELLLNGHSIGYLDPSDTDQTLHFDRIIAKPGENNLTIISSQGTSLTIYLSLGAGICRGNPPLPPSPPVGGVIVSVDKLVLLAPWIGLAAVIISAAAVTLVFVKRRRKQ